MSGRTLGEFIMRLFFSLFFVAAGVKFVVTWNATLIAAGSVFGESMAVALSIIAVVICIAGGLSVFFNVKRTIGAAAIALFLCAGIYMYWVWGGRGLYPPAGEVYVIHAAKNFVLLGVALRYVFG